MNGKYYGVERSKEYLEHFGIPGMKWGKHKSKSSYSVKKSKKKKSNPYNTISEAYDLSLTKKIW